MKLLLICCLLMLLLCGCSAAAGQAPSSGPAEIPLPTDPPAPETQPPTEAPTEAPDPLQLLLESMSLEERVGQLFLARCNSETAVQDIQRYHLGGYVLFGIDLQDRTPESMADTLAQYQAAARIPLLIAVDEEGGTVTRVSRYPQYRSEPFPSPRSLYSQGGMEAVLSAEQEKCGLLSELGINVNLAPVCDISTQPGAILYSRSLGADAAVTSEFISGTVAVMQEHRIGSVLKHFPGYGNNADTHVQIAYDSRSLETLEGCDLIPFRAGIEAGAGAVMVSHTIVEAMDPHLPASLSPEVHQYLRSEMGFEGVIMTDDLVMSAITEQFGAGEAAVLAVLAGNDILCCTEYALQYEAVLDAVLTGRIDYYTLTDSVMRILRWKQSLGLL